jgi:hypothetical protein
VQAATLLRRWDVPVGLGVEVPASVLVDSYRRYRKMRERTTMECATRGGVDIVVDRRSSACQQCLTMPLERPVRGGTRIRVPRGEGTIVGA